TLVIPLTEPLPEGTTLTILDLPTDDPADFVDTGVLADVSEDGLEIRIPIEPVEASEAALRAGGSGTPKPKGKAAAQNCLGCPTVAISRTAKKKWGLSAGDAAQEVYNANKHLTAPERQAVADALNNGYNGVVGYVDHKIYRAIQDTFYEVETFSNKLNSKKVGKNLVLEQLKPGCELDVEKKFKKLANDGTPAILNQNRAAFDPTTDRFAHALPVDFRRDAKGNPISTKVQTKNAPVLSKAEQKFIIDQRKAKGEDTTEGAVLYSDADQWNKHQRSQRSAEAVESEFKRLGDPDFGKRKNLPPVDKRGQPWGTMRLLVPRDKPKASPKPIVRYPLTICTADDVSFPCTGDCPDDEATPGDGSDSVAGRCWEITLADVVAHVDSVSGLPEDVDPATIPDTIPVNDMIASAASVIYHFDDAVRLERIWLGLPEVPPELESEIFFDTMELVRLTEANTDWVPGMMTFSNTSQDVQVSADGTRWTVRWSFDINVTAEGASATGTFAYNILDGVFRGVPADRFDSAGYSSTVEVRATNPETGEAMQVRMSATGTASGQLSDTCPDPALENVLSQEEMAALAAESME
ncbi:MAG: hypothetical protein GY778_15465, partial [bacterium]|nr:hypothetical protein [bacterium]